MASTDKKVGYSPTGNLADVTPQMAASGIETALRMLEGRWKMVIVFHLFDRGTLRFSLGHTSTAADVEAVAKAIGPAVERARAAGLS